MNGDLKRPIGEYSPLALAYMGDAVFTIFMREHLLRIGNAPVNALHKKSAEYVNAAAQAQMYHRILPFLTENEQAVMKRGRNAKSNSKAKNADIADYRHATGLEALFGYLFLKGDIDRAKEIFEKCMEL